MNLDFLEKEHITLSPINTNRWLAWLSQNLYLKLIKQVMICLLIICGVISAKAQNEPNVSEVSALTSDMVQIQISAPQSVIKGNDIVINYVVSNKGKKNIYLVVETSSPSVRKEKLVFKFSEPAIGADEHLPFDYEFVKIRPNKKYNGRLVLSKNVISSSGLQNLSNAEIQVGFSYLFDISNLERCKQTTYRLPCVTELYEKSKSLAIGNLIVEMKKS